MTAPFAAIQARINQAEFKHLANATASIAGGQQVSVIFEASYREEFGMSGTGPVARVLDTDAPSVAQGDSVEIGSANYTVVAVEPDGTGATVLRLQEA